MASDSLLCNAGRGGGHDEKGEVVMHRRAGVWDVMWKKFFRAVPIEAWIVVCFEPRAQGQMIERFVKGLLQEMTRP